LSYWRSRARGVGGHAIDAHATTKLHALYRGGGRMMKKRVAASLVGAMLLLGAPSAAQAHTHRCVTRKEFRRVHKGDSKRRVHRIFDTRGLRVYGNPGGRNYRPCRRWNKDVVFVDFNGRGKLVFKLAYRDE
jgi:hypothetical protein